MSQWIKLAERAVSALERIATALEAADPPVSTEMIEHLEERHAA